jgi:hypothetical protein
MLVECSDALFARPLHDGAPAALQRPFKQAGQYVVEAPALEVIEPDFRHVG